MLDIRKIGEHPVDFRLRLSHRGTGDEKLIGQILGLDEEIRKLKQEGEALKSERNRASKEIGAVKAKGGDIAEASAKVKANGEQISKIGADLAAKDGGRVYMLPRIPSVNHDSVPFGMSAADNRIDRVFG